MKNYAYILLLVLSLSIFCGCQKDLIDDLNSKGSGNIVKCRFKAGYYYNDDSDLGDSIPKYFSPIDSGVCVRVYAYDDDGNLKGTGNYIASKAGVLSSESDPLTLMPNEYEIYFVSTNNSDASQIPYFSGSGIDYATAYNVYNGIDYLWGTLDNIKVDTTLIENNVYLWHMGASIEIIVDSPSNGNKLKINSASSTAPAYYDCTWSLENGVIKSAPINQYATTQYTIDKNICTGLILPTQIGGNITFTLNYTLNSNTKSSQYDISIPEGGFVAGNKYIYKISVMDNKSTNLPSIFIKGVKLKNRHR